MIECWHGLAREGADWSQLFPRASWGEVSTPSYFGKSSKLPLGQDLDEEARWRVKRLQQIGQIGGPPVVIAYSWGARVALHAALAYPEFFRALVIVSAHPGLKTREERDLRLASDEVWACRFESEAASTLWRDWEAQPVLASAGEHLLNSLPRGELLDPRLDRAKLAHVMRAQGLGRQENLWPRLSEIKTPVLWIAGAQDFKYAELGKEAVSLMPKARFVALARAGHRAPWEKPEAFLSCVEAFPID